MYRLIALFFIGFVLIGCGSKVEKHPYADVRTVPQSAAFFAANDRVLVSAKQQTIYAADLNVRRFAPWDEAYEHNASRLLWPWNVYTADKGYGAHKQLLLRAWFEALAANARVETYPSANDRAITLRRVDLRNFPTQEPVFKNFALAGEGFPFDYLQNSTLHAMTPVRITHISAFGDWIFIESDHAHGWVRPNQVATLDARTILKLMDSQVVAVTTENSRIYGLNGRFLFGADIGALLFGVGEDDSEGRLLAIVSNTPGEGVLEPAWLIGTAAPWPVPADKQMLSDLADQTLGQTYGWGGLYGNRDCSALMRDLFVPLGRWLPRNSSQQAEAGERLLFEGLSSEEKIALIQAQASPFVTLIHFPGHIGLYLGELDGEPVILHSTWGHRTQKSGQEGRHIIGRTVITTLKAGSGLHPKRPNGLIDSATGLTHLYKGVTHGE